ncbi:MAG: hypothetical protein KDC24_08520 [Saprospiraceae bacterium]|nr:hypothetical protein [Saprospiraceae bacterium]
MKNLLFLLFITGIFACKSPTRPDTITGLYQTKPGNSIYQIFFFSDNTFFASFKGKPTCYTYGTYTKYGNHLTLNSIIPDSIHDGGYCLLRKQKFKLSYRKLEWEKTGHVFSVFTFKCGLESEMIFG